MKKNQNKISLYKKTTPELHNYVNPSCSWGIRISLFSSLLHCSCFFILNKFIYGWFSYSCFSQIWLNNLKTFFRNMANNCFIGGKNYIKKTCSSGKRTSHGVCVGFCFGYILFYLFLNLNFSHRTECQLFKFVCLWMFPSSVMFITKSP